MFIAFQNWNEVLVQAKNENKYILLDFYATWCGPCKKMDAEVYTDDKVVNYANLNFIPVKVQVDQTKGDEEKIRKWYSEAAYLVKAYQVEALPTFLFFSPDGQLVQKSEGYQDSAKFLALLKTASNPKTNYSGLVKSYWERKIPAKNLLSLALDAKAFHNDSLANLIAMDYKKNWLETRIPDKIIPKETITFSSAFYLLLSIDDKLIKYMYSHQAESDEQLNSKGFSKNLTDFVITKDVINRIIKPNGQYVDMVPDWDAVEKKISRAYDQATAKRLILNSKLSYYNDKKDWSNLIKYNIEKLETLGIDTSGLGKSNINNMVYYVLVQHSDDPVVLNKGLGYMELILKNNPHRDTWIDTYAALLYKIGRKQEAIKHEQDAIVIAEKKKDTARSKEYEITLRKMQKGLPL